MKTCSTCKLSKPFIDFNKNRRNADGHHRVCKTCAREYMDDFRVRNRDTILAKERVRTKLPHRKATRRAWAKANPDKVKSGKLRDSYGITLDEWRALFITQGSCCAICGTTTLPENTSWSTDHCHRTGKVRGILCGHCNRLLGFARDNIETLRAAIAYLERHK